MKNKSASQSALICLFTVLAFALCNSSARGDCTDTWSNTSSGDWFTAANWSNGVPTSSTSACINDGGTAQINSSDGTAFAYTLTLGNASTETGTVVIDGGQLDTSWDVYVGNQGTGTLNITDGGSLYSIDNAYIAASGSSAASKGSVSVKGSGSYWQIGNVDWVSARLFVSDGGTALLSITDGGTVEVYNNSSDASVNVGGSGTLTGNGTITTIVEPTVAIYGTLAPSGGTLTIGASGDTSNLILESVAATECNVTPSAADNVAISGTATLSGRLSVTMTGTFTNGTTQYTLLTRPAA